MIRQRRMRAGKERVPPMRKRTTAHYLMFSFVTSLRIEP